MPKVNDKYECDHCDSLFYRKDALDRHVKTLHMNNKKLVCNLCAKKFSRLDNMNDHKKKTHGIKS